MQKELNSSKNRIAGYITSSLALMVIALELFRSLQHLTYGLGDLGSFIESGKAGAAGLDPYGVYPLTLRVLIHGAQYQNQNLNPPISVLLFKLFTFARPHMVARQWYLIQGIFYLFFCLWLSRHFPQTPRRSALIWMLALTAFWDTMFLGQIYIPLFALGGIAWVMLKERKPWIAGLCIGTLVALKPQFILWPVFLLLGRFFLPALVSLATAGILSVIPLFVYGKTIYVQWLRALEGVAPRIPIQTNASLPGLFSRVQMYYLGLGVGVALCVLTVAWILWRRPTVLKVTTFALLVTLLVSPLAWVHYSLVLIPVYLSRWKDVAFRLPAYFLVIPARLIVHAASPSGWHLFTIGSAYTWALVITLGLVIAEEIKESRASATSAGAPA
jgi:hypothetical protein